jgi:hypothetical protein
MKNFLIETVSEEEIKLVEDFIRANKLKGFRVEDSKAGKEDVFNDVIRMLIPLT